ncbi:MAG: FAD-dependent oxidoreductase [Gammaproteobacteria bacterium]|nr:MAG: FAD-dependent oxidoreductase [Gammaproteobacteria bacterium]
MTHEAFSNDLKLTPWWWEAAPPRPESGTALPPEADVAIVGAGYSGLAAALTLARAGRRVVVVDAEAPGDGASSRNGGQCGSGNQKFTAAQLIARHGENKARALVSEGLAMLRHLGEFIESEGIECHFARVGRFRGATIPRHYEDLARDMRDMRKLAGVESHMVPRAEQHTEVGSDFYHGGAVLPNDGSLHPALYHRGLLQRAEEAGVQVIGHTPVTGVVSGPGQITVRTTRGRLRAGCALIATNGYTGTAFPQLKRRVAPIGSAMIATETLDPALLRRLMPKNRVVGSSSRIYHYIRLCPQGKRFLWGGRVKGGTLPEGASGFAHLYGDMLRVFPELEGTRISHCWSGYVAYTYDVFPHLGQRDGIYYAMGYCGSGVVRATYFGHKIALKILGDKQGRTAFDDLDFRNYPVHFLASRMVPAVTEWYRFRDWLERRD